MEKKDNPDGRHSKRRRAGRGQVVAEVGQAEPQKAGDLGKERRLLRYKQWGCAQVSSSESGCTIT